MASAGYEYDNTAVGHLYFHYSKQPIEERELPIIPNYEFDIGRRDLQEFWGINDLTISTHHLRFRCGVYDDEDGPQVSPMVYVRVLSQNPISLMHAKPEQGDTVSRDDGDVLLDHGDVLQLTLDISLVFQAEKCCSALSNTLSSISSLETERFQNQFIVSGRSLGSGGQASVLVAVKQQTGRQVACKVVPMPTRTDIAGRLYEDLHAMPQEREAIVESEMKRQRENLTREYNILTTLNHPNIVKLEKVFCATFNIYIFQELITGGDLHSYLDLKGAMPEAQAATIALQLLKAVEYLHSNGIVHRDIKPENVLMTSWRDGARIVLTDFGQARTAEDAKNATRDSAVFRMQSLVGTNGYAAPEVLKRDLRAKGYSRAVDIWSIGCVVAVILTGNLMFPDYRDEHNSVVPILNAPSPQYPWDLSIMEQGWPWTGVGRKAKSFIRGCLTLKESDRLTAKQALLHPWFTNKHYAAEMEAAYQRAIQDWKPQEQNDRLIEFINTTDAMQAGPEPAYIARVCRRGQVSSLPTSSACKHFPLIPQWGNVFADSTGASCFTQFPSQGAHRAMGSFSIENFAPPKTQSTLPLTMKGSLSSLKNIPTKSPFLFRGETGSRGELNNFDIESLSVETTGTFR